MFERLRAAISAALEAATPPPNLRDLVGQMRQAVVELRASIAGMRQALEATGQQLAAERRSRAEAERRGRLAAEIKDQETVGVAERFVGRHALSEEHAAGGPSRRLVGFELDWATLEAAFDRHGLPTVLALGTSREPIPIHAGGRWVGKATSMTWSPILKRRTSAA